MQSAVSAPAVHPPRTLARTVRIPHLGRTALDRALADLVRHHGSGHRRFRARRQSRPRGRSETDRGINSAAEAWFGQAANAETANTEQAAGAELRLDLAGEMRM